MFNLIENCFMLRIMSETDVIKLILLYEHDLKKKNKNFI